MSSDITEKRKQSAVRGIMFMLGATLLAAMMNSAARHVVETVHPFELVFFRNLFAFLFVAPLLWRVGMVAFKTTRLPLHGARAGLNVVNMFVWFTAVSMAPLSEVVALGFTAPIFATILSVIILREVVGIRRWSAILIGFAGALIILQPGFDTVSAGHGLTLLAATMWAGVLLMIKTLSRTDSSVTMVVYMSVLMTPISLIPALFVWVWPTWTELGWMAMIGFAGGASQYLLAQAFHEADIGVIMPFDFMKLVWVSIIAFLIFSEIPTFTTWVGGAVIFASGFYIARREAVRNAEKAKTD